MATVWYYNDMQCWEPVLETSDPWLEVRSMLDKRGYMHYEIAVQEGMLLHTLRYEEDDRRVNKRLIVETELLTDDTAQYFTK